MARITPALHKLRIALLQPGAGLAKLQRELEAQNDDEAHRVLVAGDALLQLGFSPLLIRDALLLLAKRSLTLAYDKYSDVIEDDGLNDLAFNFTDSRPLLAHAFQSRFGIEVLNSDTGEKAASLIKAAYARLVPYGLVGTERAEVKRLLKILLKACEKNPDAILEVTAL